MSRSIRCDNGPPFFSKGFKDFCKEYCIRLDLTSPYNPESSGAAERGVGLIKLIMKKTEEEGTCFEEALAVFRNTRNESGYSPNQLFFLRNWRDHNLPDLRAEPVVEEMEKARERVKGGCKRLQEDETKRAWPKLYAGDMVRGQDPKTKEWSLKGEVLEMVHGDRAVNVDLDDGRTRLFERKAVKKDTTKTYREAEEEELRSQMSGTALEVREDGQLEESMGERRKRQRPNMEETEPRRSLRLAKKRVTMGRLGTVDDPKVLPYYMEAEEQGWAGTKKMCPRNVPEETEVSGEVSAEVSGKVSGDQEECEVDGKDPGEVSGQVSNEEQ